MTISINIIGLLVVQLLETWRPGAVSSVVPLPLIWLLAVILIGLSTWPRGSVVTESESTSS